MKKESILSLITLCIIILCSCTDTSRRTFDKFPSTLPLHAEEKIQPDSILFTYPKMKVDGDICCIADFDSKKYFFHLYSFPEFKYITSFGTKGKGHDEILMLTDFDFKNGVVAALCGATSKIYIYNYNLTTLPIMPSSIINYDKSVELSSICIGDSSLYATAMNGEYGVVELDKRGDICGQYIKLPDGKEYRSLLSVNVLWQRILGFNKANRSLVAATVCGDVIDVVNMEKEGIRIVGKLGEPRTVTNSGEGYVSDMQQYQTYVDLCPRQNIYALFCGEEFKKGASEMLENSIRVFDYQGIPIIKYELEKATEYSSLYVDEENGYIYCLAPEEEELIHKFKI